jgi:hypothetical protein
VPGQKAREAGTPATVIRKLGGPDQALCASRSDHVRRWCERTARSARGGGKPRSGVWARGSTSTYCVRQWVIQLRRIDRPARSFHSMSLQICCARSRAERTPTCGRSTRTRANLIDGCPGWQTLPALRTALAGGQFRLVDCSLSRRFHPVPITRLQRRSCRTVQNSIVLQQKASVGKFPLRTAFGSLPTGCATR